MDAEQIIRNLRYTQKKHEHDTLLTLQTDISAMARDSADCIETLQVQLAEKEKERQRWQDDFNQLNALHKREIIVTGEYAQRVIDLTARAEAAEARADAAGEDITAGLKGSSD